MNLPLIKDFHQLFLKDKSFRIFLVATIIGLAFSISIVLSTLGLMDGFSNKLKTSLNAGNGEIVMSSQKGFFSPLERNLEELKEFGIKSISYLIQTQSFLTAKQNGKAVIVYGVDKSYEEISSLKVPAEGEMLIGETLAKDLGLSVGNEVSLTFAAGRSGEKYLPAIARFKIALIKKFNIHHYDERYVYIDLKSLQNILKVDSNVNLVNLKLEDQYQSVEEIENLVTKLKGVYYWDFQIRPYWGEFSSFLKAVDFEKNLISLVLYLVVFIAAFNCLAFIVFAKEKKAQEIFLLYAVGLSPKRFRFLWYLQNFLIWLISFALSFIFVAIFDHAITTWSMFEIPSDVYYLGRLEVLLSLKSILITAVISCTLVMFLTFLVLRNLNSKSLISGLREEFS